MLQKLEKRKEMRLEGLGLKRRPGGGHGESTDQEIKVPL
jgi:hypothetical protein